MDKRDELLRGICIDMIEHDKVQSSDWLGISLVIRGDQGMIANSGYIYLNDDKIKPFSIGGKDFADKADLFRKETQVFGEDPWSQCLIRIRKFDGKINVEFDYADPGKWTISSKNMKTLPKEIKPDFQ